MITARVIAHSRARCVGGRKTLTAAAQIAEL